MSNRRRVNISLDPATYERLRRLMDQYHFANMCEMVVALLRLMLSRAEAQTHPHDDLPEDDAAYIDAMFDELGEAERRRRK